MKLTKLVMSLLTMLFSVGVMNAQVTSSAMSGSVKNKSGKLLADAKITAVYTATNIKYATKSSINGRYSLSNMQSGGPYTITIEAEGYKTQTIENEYLQLADVLLFDPVLESKISDVIIVTGVSGGSKAKSSGASTNIGRAEIQRLPTVSRSLNDITRLTPQSNGASVGGGNYRQNNVTVDGADFNNNFGIGTNLPANGSPISLDAIDQISVSLSPFDVRQSGFIGSSLNAVTRSGNNKFSGSVYRFFRTEKEQGKKVNGATVTRTPFEYEQLGIRFGGPIIKDKLFFFLSYETDQRPTIVQTRVASTPGNPFSAANTGVARPTADSLNYIRNYLKTKYGYETGEYDNYTLNNGNTKILGRIDWNINKNNRFNVRYNQVEGGSPSTPSTSNTGLTVANFSASRTAQTSMWFRNSNYFQGSNFYSVSAELNSTIGKRFTNTLRGSYTNQDDSRTSESAIFPFVDILSNTGVSAPAPYTSFGYEPFTLGNLRKVKSYSFFDNVTINLNKHIVTAGVQADFNKTINGFQRAAMSYYSFNSWSDFENGLLPTNYAITYSLSPGFNQAFPSFKFAQYSAFVQDDIAINERFKLTVGLRADLPTYPDVDEIKTHPLVAAMTFNGGQKINTGALPNTRIMISPRIGFNWDVNGDRSFQIKGGTGIFTGKVPFVWIVSQSGDAGLLQVNQVFTGTSVPGPFNPNPAAYLPRTVPVAGTVVPSSVSAISPNFRFPQALKINLGFEKKITKNLNFSMEGVYNRDLYSAIFENPNLVTPSALNFAGYADNRLIYPSATASKFINTLNAAGLPTAGGTSVFNTYLLKNGKKGYYGSITAKLEKKFSKGFSAFVAYTGSIAQNLFDGSGDQPGSAWQGTPTISGANNSPLATASFVLPHRFIASVSYAKEYLKHLKTTVSLFYEGSAQNRYSYIYSTDFNRDGNFNDLMYIPNDAAELTPYLVSKTFGTGASAVTLTPAQQADAFFAYVNQDKYLSKRKGQYTQRNEGLFPFRHQLDFKLMQDIFVNIGKNRNTLQFSVDIFNFTNLLNKDWGAFKSLNLANGLLVPTNVSSLVAGGAVRPTFQLGSDAAGNVPTKTYRTVLTVGSTYFMQFGLRYLFN